MTYSTGSIYIVVVFVIRRFAWHVSANFSEDYTASTFMVVIKAAAGNEIRHDFNTRHGTKGATYQTGVNEGTGSVDGANVSTGIGGCHRTFGGATLKCAWVH
jgi:hypothetical protein